MKINEKLVVFTQIILGFLFIFLGGLVCLIYSDILIIRFLPFSSWLAIARPHDSVAGRERVLPLFVPWALENPLQVTVVWNDKDKNENLFVLSSTWLRRMYVRSFLPRDVLVTAAACCGDEAYISFDSNFLSDDWSIQKKYLCVEALLKTIRKSFPALNYGYFLVRDGPLRDRHLDFSQRWPLEGFV